MKKPLPHHWISSEDEAHVQCSRCGLVHEDGQGYTTRGGKNVGKDPGCEVRVPPVKDR